jgi:hypothetical protein
VRPQRYFRLKDGKLFLYALFLLPAVGSSPIVSTNCKIAAPTGKQHFFTIKIWPYRGKQLPLHAENNKVREYIRDNEDSDSERTVGILSFLTTKILPLIIII